MAAFEQIEEIIDEISKFTEVNSEADDQFRARFSSPKTINHFVTFIECLVTKYKEDSLKRDRLILILIECINNETGLQNLLYSSVLITEENSSNLLHKLINILVSLPDLISNIYGRKCPEELTVTSYTKQLCTILQKVLLKVHANQTFFNLSHFHLIFGRLCLRGHSQIVWDNLLKKIVPDIITDEKWLKIARQILLSNSSQTLPPEHSILIEPIFKTIFSHSPCHRFVDKVFDYEYLKTINDSENFLTQIEFLLTNKFLLIIPSSSISPNSYPFIDPFLFNIFTYLFLNNRQWLSAAIDNILDTWANSSAFKHRSYYQHFYFARQLITTAKLLFQYQTDSPVAEFSLKFRRVILFGAEIHLKSAQMEFRAIGLTTTVIVLDLLAKHSSLQIETPKFDEVDSTNNEECLFLKTLATLDMKQIFDADLTNGGNKTKDFEKPELKNTEAQSSSTVPSKPTKKVELDSDDDEDDLQPYDLSNDIRLENDIRFVGKDIETSQRADTQDIQSVLLIDNSTQMPIYLQDCMEGLVQTEKPQWAEKCLLSAEKIIRANFANAATSAKAMNQDSPLEYGRLNAVALRFTEILFHLDNQLSLDNFEQLRINALVALCIGAPKIAAKYISGQFYAPHLPIGRRLEVLSVLTMASEELSRPLEALPKSDSSFIENNSLLNGSSKVANQFERKYFSISYSTAENEDSDDEQNEDDEQKAKDWKSVVTQRIKANTRYIAPQSLKQNFETVTTTTSRFVPIAGHFILPLLRDPNKTEIRLNLSDEDSFVLEHLFYALGVLLQNCVNYPQVKLMAKEVLEFITAYRNHEMSNVRLSVIMVFQAILTCTPTFYLFDDLMSSIAEFQLWLQEIVLCDTDRNCSQNAIIALNQMRKLASSSEKNINPVESKFLSSPTVSTDSNQSVQPVTTLDLNSTIRIIRHTNLK